MARYIYARPVWRSRPYVLATLLLLIGTYLAIGGAWLVALGGSFYYVITGFVVIASGVLLWFGVRWGSWLYGLMLIGTAIWAYAEVGWQPWALAPRVLPPLVLGIWLLMPWVRHGLGVRPVALEVPASELPPPSEREVERARQRRRAAVLVPVLIGAIILIAAAVLFIPKPAQGTDAGESAGQPQLTGDSAATSLQSAAAAATATASNAPPPAGDWRNYGNTLQGSRFSALNQINDRNVRDLKLAWTLRTGDLPRAGEKAPREFTDEATPLKVGDTLYTCTPHNIVIAIDAVSGRERWRFDPQAQSAQVFVIACRGVSYYEAPDASIDCPRRIIGGTIDARLFAIDAETGKPCAGFGNSGFVSLLEGMGQVRPGFHYVTSPPVIVKDRIVLGGWIDDNQSTDEPSGVVRSFDPVSGKLLWAWDMGAPERTGAPGPGEQYTRDTPNAWAPFSADPELNLVYVPTGNSPPDFWGGKRRDFDEKYSSSLVALDLDTGRPRWSFQTTHHDLWDYDIPAQPVLVDVPTAQGMVPGVVQPTKRGEIFVLNRETGAPLVPVTEKPVPQGAAPGDHASPTQPFSAISLLPPKLVEADMWGATPLDQLVCRIKFRQARYDGVLTPPGLQPTVAFPGALGVVDWGGVAVDQTNKLIVANTSAIPYYDQLIPREKAPPHARVIGMNTPAPGIPQADYAWSPQVGTPYVMHLVPFMGPLKIPCTQPPWGFMQVIDLKTHKPVWKHPIGTAQDYGPMGIPTGLPIPMGVPNLGGSIVTAGNVIFNASTVDRYLRAYDLNTGEELWKARLPAGGQATPMTYLGSDGRQYVAITAGGHQGLDTKTGDYLIAYALPKTAG